MGIYKRKIELTQLVFRAGTRHGFHVHVKPKWVGEPILYLEIGVFEGMSMVWMFENVLTHPESRAIGIDPWLELPPRSIGDLMEEVMGRAERNLEPWKDRCKLLRMNSAEMLMEAVVRPRVYNMTLASIDVCLIDGCHQMYSVMQDAELVLPMMKPGGWLLFDDINPSPRKMGHAYDGLQLFLSKHGDRVEELWRSQYLWAYEVKGK